MNVQFLDRLFFPLQQLSDVSCFNSKIVETDVEGYSLIETHLLPSDLSSSDLFSDCSDTFDWRTVSHESLQSSAGNVTPEPVHIPVEIASLTNGELRVKLMEFGDSPGPIVHSTRKTHELRLSSYLQGSPSSKAGQSSSGRILYCDKCLRFFHLVKFSNPDFFHLNS